MNFRVVFLAAAVAAAPVARPDPALTPSFGPMEFSIAMPQARPGTAEPILALGAPGRGDTIFAWFEKAGRMRFGWCSTESGTLFSRPVAVVGSGPHRLRISIGSLQPESLNASDRSADEALRRYLLIEFDGRMALLCEGRFQPVRGPGEIALGANRIGAAFVRAFFTGSLGKPRAVPPARALAEAFELDHWIAGDAVAPRWPGAVRLTVRFSDKVAPAGDPLVVTGRTGKGDLLYVQTLDSGHVRFGFDHWGVGGAVSPAMAADLEAVHEIVLTMGSLHGPGLLTPEPWSRRVEVWLDGRRALSTESACHPTTTDRIVIGRNPIGGSTTGAAFRGQIFGADRVSLGDLGALPQ